MKLDIPKSSKSASLQALREAGYPVSGLLGNEETNPKVAKNSKVGVLTWQLHLTPFNYSGRQVCPKATKGCSAACLHFAGNPAYMSAKEKSRQFKTDAWFDHRPLFMGHLINELKSLESKAKRKNMIAGCRLNATSDLPWERISFTYDGKKYSNLMELFPNISFYDYTKRPNRKTPSNYRLTFSLAEDNDEDAFQALLSGMNVAAVFDVKRGKELPSFMYWTEFGKAGLHSTEYNRLFNCWRVIDGDKHDYRPDDPERVIVGLRAKGPAIGDKSGFVRPVHSNPPLAVAA